MSYSFNGAGSYIAIPSGHWGHLSLSGWTVAMWFKVVGSGTVGTHQHHLISKSGSDTNGTTLSLRITESNDIFTFLARDDNTNLIVSTNAIDPPNNAEWSNSGWVHVVVAKSTPYDSANTTSTTNDSLHYAYIYFNGNLTATDTRTGCIDINCNPIYLGRRGDSTTNLTLSGNIAEFATWNRRLSQTEITQLYLGHSPHFLKPAIYLPLRNDTIDHMAGVTGLVFSNTQVSSDHPIDSNVYIQLDDKANIWNLSNRIGALESKGFNDTVAWSPGQIASGVTVQSGLFFSQARVGDAYVVAGNASLSGCVATAHVDTSGILTISVRNPSNILQGVQATSWRVYKL